MNIASSVIATDSPYYLTANDCSTVEQIIDIACGQRSIILLTETGKVYQYEKPTRSQSEMISQVVVADELIWQQNDEHHRKVHFQRISNIPEDVRCMRIVTGWNHMIVRGIRINGDQVCYGWGRCDMMQYLTADSREEYCTSSQPTKVDEREKYKAHELKSLPEGHKISEIWCGSEFTVVADEEGYLWACGWNEHGNLGLSSIEDDSAPAQRVLERIVSHWQPIFYSSVTSKIIRIALWEGSIACGGAHILFLPQQYPS
jgi:alpha-tubulin suppressor-like RCC1 family protein